MRSLYELINLLKQRQQKTAGWPDDASAGFNEEPEALAAIIKQTNAIGFVRGSQIGALLRVMAASKPGGQLLELGTGTGIGTCWLLDGMDSQARIITVDIDPIPQAAARQVLDEDPRITFINEDAQSFLRRQRSASFDLIFSDAPPGKYTDQELSLALLRPGGLYICDDIRTEPNWPAERVSRVQRALAELGMRPGFRRLYVGWRSGVIILAKTAESPGTGGVGT